MSSQKKSTRINREITAPRVRLIGDDGSQVGIVNVREALDTAKQVGLDLVEISPNADPPVCRIMDYGKFQFSQNKQKAAAKKKQKQIQVKEVKFRPGTGESDFQVKLRNIHRFLEDGDKVKVTLRFRGREMVHQELGLEVLQRVESELEGLATIEQKPKLEGRQLVMVVVPLKK